MEASEELLLPGLYHTQPLVQPYPPPPVPERLIGEQNVPTEARFIPDEWGPCSVTCGEGIKKRNVFCKIFLEFSRTIAKLPDKQCSGPKPVEEEKCFMDHCDVADKMGVDVKDDPYTRSKIKIASGSPAKSYSWREQGYTHCSATCLGGIQEMIVNCVRDDTQKVTSPYMCPIELKPEIKIQTCNEHPCPPRWNYSEFSQCSQSCGLGIQTREVNCIHEVAQGGGNALIVPNNMCPQPPPPDRQYCNVLDCPVRWKVQEWSRCSKSCGGGQKTRKVECKQVMAQNHTVDRPPAMCPQPKPAETKPCNTKSCVVDSDRPHIDVSNSTFIQHDFKKKKISLRVGGAATVFVGTTIKIKCPVKRFDRAKIQWLKDKSNLPRAKKYKVSKKGALRVSNLGFKDGGLYTCVAGKSSANIAISVRAKPGEMGTGESSKQSGTEEGSTSGKKKAGTKTRLFTPTLPSLRLDTSLDEQSTLNKNEQERISHMPSSSSEYLNPPGGGTSSASRLMPNFHRLVSNLKYLWPFQTLSNSRGHRMIEFPRNSLEVGNSLPAQMSIEERGFQGENRGDRDDLVVFGRGSVANGQLLFEWKTSSWTKCTETCGGEGFQVRMARCLVRFYNTSQTVDSTLCEEAGLAVPMTRRKCGFDDCPEWVAYDWSTCENSKCVGFHKAVQRRLVKCEIGRNLTVDPNKCDPNKKPVETQDCYNDRCVGKWRVGTWSKCEAECGMEGNKYRIIQCVWHGTKKAAGTACKDLIKPPVMKNCLGPPCQMIKEPTTACSDQSVFCPNVKAMNMCRIKRYKQQCCDSCKD
ncbi:unnamed protein product [Callosobruchus maculatus]|uniref:Ig-like domain-containing protein n=1 Tax=Callosobruchus maculatus TaxID=64391 RepID=A0A653D7D2_CALMS|nr:unnamed protein product [Callosobruchus maculatus]